MDIRIFDKVYIRSPLNDLAAGREVSLSCPPQQGPFGKYFSQAAFELVSKKIKKTISYSRLCILSFVIVLVGCKDSINPIENSDNSNRISNGSFEISGAPSLNGWQSNSNDTSRISFSNTVPQSGGNYSIKLKNDWTSPGTISTKVIPLIGTHRYRLSAWAKVLTSGTKAGGEMSILTKRGLATTFGKSYQFSDTSWTFGELNDTITTATMDTVIIKLQGNSDQISFGHILFDLCVFEKID